nr:flagella basal body P-ring formation protein FlgA [uncultured Sphingorhabdus sp.]
MLVLIFALLTTPPQFEDLEILDERIQAENVSAEPVDKRLKLAQCPAEPIVSPAVGDAVVVRCPALGWRLRVPVRAASNAAENSQIVIRKGDLIECISGGPGFSVSTQLIAMDDARVGQSLRVKSPTSSVFLTAVAKSQGQATL